MSDWSWFWSLLFLLLVLSLIPDVAYLLAKIFIEPLVHVFQRRVLGINRVNAGPETMIGARAMVTIPSGLVTDAGYTGRVHIQGEDWVAVSDVPLAAGVAVVVLERTGLRLQVAPVVGMEEQA